MAETALKDMTKNRSLKAGHFVVEFDSPGIGHIVKNAGSEFVVLDTEHSGFGIETVARSEVRVSGAQPVSAPCLFPFPHACAILCS